MKFDKSMLTLYAVTDRAYLRGRRLEPSAGGRP